MNQEINSSGLYPLYFQTRCDRVEMDNPVYLFGSWKFKSHHTTTWYSPIVKVKWICRGGKRKELHSKQQYQLSSVNHSDSTQNENSRQFSRFAALSLKVTSQRVDRSLGPLPRRLYTSTFNYFGCMSSHLLQRRQPLTSTWLRPLRGRDGK